MFCSACPPREVPVYRTLMVTSPIAIERYQWFGHISGQLLPLCDVLFDSPHVRPDMIDVIA